VELQIRTRAMHSVAEYGVAAHSLYKDTQKMNGGANGASAKNLVFSDKESGPYQWLRRLVETLLEGSNPEEFLEHTKLELFQDQVFCFSPKGRLIALPRGATPLDFAYAVHTDIGNAAVSAYVNGRHVPIDTRLRNGDEVEIKTSKTHTPPAAWESLAVTGRARSAIRRAARDAIRRQYAELGRRLLISAFERIGESYSDERIRKVLPRLSHKSLDDLLAAIARNEVKTEDVLRAVAPELAATARAAQRPEEPGKAKGWLRLTRAAASKLHLGGASEGETAAGGPPAGRIPIRGVKNDMPVLFEAGGAVPGDRIVGVLAPGEGIRVFQIHSPRLQEYEHERWIDVAWDVDPENPERFPALISVTAPNRPGALAEIADVIGQAGGNIDTLKMLRRASDFTELKIGLEVWNLAHLNEIINGLKAKAVVSKVERVFE
jgi:GTP pyrophosphokinase